MVSRPSSRTSPTPVPIPIPAFSLPSRPLTPHHPPRRIRHGRTPTSPLPPLPPLHDTDQPFTYTIRLYNRAYRFEFCDTASPTHYTLLRPHFVIICYDVSDRRSLVNAQQVWRRGVSRWYEGAEGEVPVMLLGLKRDLRREGEGVVEPLEVGGSFFREGGVGLCG